jgi:uncharacterized protein
MSQTDLFRGRGLAGEALAGEVVIDAHMHIERFYNFFIPGSSLPEIIAGARRIGIRRMYGSSLLALRGDAASGNANALAAREAFPTEFAPYLVVKPNYPEETPAVIALSEREKIRHFKIHDDGNDRAYDDRAYYPFYEWGSAAQAVILAHTWGRKHVVPLMKVAGEFPGLTLILGHSGITEEEVYAEAVRKHRNIYLETCSSLAWYGLIERLVKMAGAERVLFGTDVPFMSPDQQVGRILFSRISDEEKRLVLGLNAQRLFGEEEPR